MPVAGSDVAADELRWSLRTVKTVRMVRWIRNRWSRLGGFGRTVAMVVGAGVAVALVALLTVRLAPDWLAATDGLSRKDKAEELGRVRTALLALLAGLIAVTGAIYTARSYRLNRAAHELDQQREITGRFSRAIEHIGEDTKLDVRLGGIYSLERIARDSRHDHPTIMDVLAAFIRHRAPWPSASPTSERASPRPDVNAALTVIARRDSERDGYGQIDLRDVDLRGAELNIPLSADLTKIDLRGAHLEKAQLYGVRLGGTDLRGAHLDGAELPFGSLFAEATETTVEGRVKLDKASLKRAKLYRADLRWAV